MHAQVIRRATEDDEPFLVEMLYQALFVPPGEAPLPRSVLDKPDIAHYVRGFGRQRGDVGYVAETVPGEPLGAAWVRQLTSDDPGYGYVDDHTPELSIAVVAECRRTGVGTDLLEYLLDRVPRCSLSVDERNPAIRLYGRFGFEIIATKGTSATMLRSK